MTVIVKGVELEIPAAEPGQPETVETLKEHIGNLEYQLTEMGKDLTRILLPFLQNDAEGLLAALGEIARDHCRIEPKSPAAEVLR